MRGRERRFFFFSLSLSLFELEKRLKLTTSTIKQTVTGLDGVVNGIRGHGVVDLPEAKAHLGHLISAVELDRGGRHLAC